MDACRYGDPEAATAVYARLAILADAVFPSLVARSMAFMNRLTEKATAANNEVPR